MRIRSFNPANDAETVAALLAVSFGGGPADPAHVRSLRRTKPSECRNRRVAEDDGKVVAYLEIVPKEIYVGRSLLSVGGIAGVCTDPSARMKGYGRALMRDTVEFMRREGYDFTLLYGIPNYYYKFGYEVVMGRHLVTVAQAEIPSMNLKYSRRAAGEKDLPGMKRLYNGQARFRDGNCLRRTMRLRKNAFKLTDSRGRLAAYAIWSAQDGTLAVREGMARDGRAGRALLGALKGAAWNQALDHVSVLMPFGYPLTDAMRPLASTYRRANTNRGGCMGRVLNLDSLARKLTREWTRLLVRSELAAARGRVNVRIGDETLALSYAKGRISTDVTDRAAEAEVSQEKFSQMLFGYAGVKELADSGEVRIPKVCRRLFEILFPERTSFLFVPDHF